MASFAGESMVADLEGKPISLKATKAPPFQAQPSRRVLVIDNDPAWGAFVTRALAGLPWVEVFTAPDGTLGFDLAYRNPPDLMLLDLRMPGQDGFEVLRNLKGAPETKSVPGVVVTAVDDTNSRASALSAQAVDYVTKPVAPDQLKALVSSWCLKEAQ